MKTQEIDTKETQYKFAALRDARMKSAAAQSNYTARQQNKCTAMKVALEHLYICKEVYLTYRERFTAAIKVEHPRGFTDRKALRRLEDSWETDPTIKYNKKKSAQGYIYQITVL